MTLRGWRGKYGTKEESQGTAEGLRSRQARHQLEDPQCIGRGIRERNVTRCLPRRHLRRRGVRVFFSGALIRASGGTFAMRKKTPCATRTVGGIARVAASPPLSCLAAGWRGRAHFTGCIGGGSSDGPELSQSDPHKREGGSRETQACADGDFGKGDIITAWGWGYHSMPFSLDYFGNVSQPGKKYDHN